ncbi:MAG: response regulator [Opitutaceae bacterium]|nr:response regulator [Opitutaceae bacterium]
MTSEPADLLTPRILLVDDERRIHASVRLRLGNNYEIASCADGAQALRLLADERFDLCIVDVQMPGMDGLRFIEAAQKVDPGLGFLILSAFDSDANLRRAIPLRIYEFLPKPIPGRDGFEHRIPEWIERTRHRRRQLGLAEHAGTIAHDLDSARLERDVELVVSESARDALLQTAGLLTTIHAHLVAATAMLGARARQDPSLTHLFRSLEEARKTSDAAVTVAEGFFDGAYGNRDTSPALIGAGIGHAVQIATRAIHGESGNKAVDVPAIDEHLAIRGLSGIDFLLMMTPAVALALTAAAAGTTVRIEVGTVARLDAITKDPRFKNNLWLNRRNATLGQSGSSILISVTNASLSRSQIEAWLRGEHTRFSGVTPRGFISGIQKCRGVLGFSVVPADEPLRIVFALPT